MSAAPQTTSTPATRLARLIGKDGRSHGALSIASGLPAKRIGLLARGEGLMRVADVVALAPVLHVSPTWLAFGENPPGWAR